MDSATVTVVVFSCSLFGYGFLLGAWFQRRRGVDQARSDAAVRLLEEFTAAARGAAR